MFLNDCESIADKRSQRLALSFASAMPENTAPDISLARDAAALDGTGVRLLHQGRPREAVRYFHAALALNPERAGVWYNLGTAQSKLNLHDDSITALRRCIALAPGHESARYNLAHALLKTSRWDEGWALYEARGRKRSPTYAPLPFERWQGEAPGAYVLLLTTEQGMGDAIQFVRFAGFLRQRGFTTLVWAPPPLAPLFEWGAGLGRIWQGGAPKIEGRSVKWAPLMSVPALIGLRPERVPAAPYLAPPPERRAHWAGRLGGGGFKVGIAWQGNPAHPRDPFRSMPLAELEPLVRIPGVRLVSLQKSPGSEAIATVPFGQAIERPIAEDDTGVASLLDTAALLVNLDLVITVDTMVAHLAGALGCTVWLALDANPDWRWLLDRQDTPWYPGMRLFRQTGEGGWGPVIQAMKRSLEQEMN